MLSTRMGNWMGKMPALLKAASQELHTFNNTVVAEQGGFCQQERSLFLDFNSIDPLKSSGSTSVSPPTLFSFSQLGGVRMCLTWEGACPKLMPRPTFGCLQKAPKPLTQTQRHGVPAVPEMVLVLGQIEAVCLSIQFLGWIMHSSLRWISVQSRNKPGIEYQKPGRPPLP